MSALECRGNPGERGRSSLGVGNGGVPEIARVAVADPELPALPRMVDPREIGALLHRRFPGFSDSVPRVSIRYVRYLPGQACRVACVAERPGRDGPERVLFYARLERRGGDLLKIRERDAADPTGTVPREDLRESIVVDPETGIVLRFFPHDASLRRLPCIRDFKVFRPIVEGAFARESDLRWKTRIDRSHFAIVRYKPEHRCVARLEIRTRVPGTSSRRGIRLFAHFASPGAGSTPFRVLSALWGREGREGPLAVARPFHYDESYGLLLQEEITGTPLALHLEREDVKKVVKRLAKRLVDIHRSGFDPGRRVTLEGARNDLAVEVEQLARIPGVDSDRVRAVGRALLGAVPKEGPGAEALLHGDLHHGQVLVKGRRTWIVDFDRAAKGDPMIDVGGFLAHLELEAHEGFLLRDPARNAGRIFRRAYERAWPEAWGRSRLRWFSAASVFRSAAAPCRQLQEGWLRRLHGRVDLAGRMLEGDHV